MSSKMMMTFLWLYISFTFISLAIEGNYYSAEDVTLANQLTGYTSVQVQQAGILAIPLQGYGFLVHGLPKIMTWDYPFLMGPIGGMFRILFIVIFNGAIVYGFRAEIGTAFQGIFAKIGSLF